CKMFGISFSNIERPHPDIVSYYIVRNERTDDDKIVVDNAIVGPCMKNSKSDESSEGIDYVTFGMIMPNFSASDVTLPDRISDDTLWFFSPEHKYSNKKYDFNRLSHQGYFIASDNPNGTAGLPTEVKSSDLNNVW